MLLLLLFILLILSQGLIIALNGKKVPVPDIPREVMVGNGPSLHYLVMGDSTAVGLGTDYKEGIAYLSAAFLAKNHTVKLTNLGVSGATTKTVLHGQAETAVALKADIVLICVGANDVTHLSTLHSVGKNIRTIIETLQKANPKVKILLTGAPAMGSVPRFPQPTKFLAGLRTDQINSVIQTVANQKSVTRIKIAEKTGAIFLKNPQLFAKDNFHPNREGYATWMPVITEVLLNTKL